MDVSTIIDAISNLGFPIACVVALFWYLNKERESHKEEMDKLTQSLNANTTAIEKLYVLIDKIESKDN